MAITAGAVKPDIEQFRAWLRFTGFIDENLIMYDNGLGKGKPETGSNCRTIGGHGLLGDFSLFHLE